MEEFKMHEETVNPTLHAESGIVVTIEYDNEDDSSDDDEENEIRDAENDSSGVNSTVVTPRQQRKTTKSKFLYSTFHKRSCFCSVADEESFNRFMRIQESCKISTLNAVESAGSLDRSRRNSVDSDKRIPVICHDNSVLLTFEDIGNMVTSLKDPTCGVEILSLQNCDLRPEVIMTLASAISNNTSVEYLNLEGNFGGNELGQMLIFNSVLLDLNLSGNELGDAGAINVGDALTEHRSLRYVDLSNNGITSVACSCLGNMLAKNTSLQHFVLAENSIGPQGAKSIAEGTGVNSTLMVLDISYQKKPKKVGAEGALALSNMLRSNSTLTSLKLAGNKIFFEGCRHLSGSLLTNSSLRELDIGGKNYLSVEGGMQLATALQRNESLRYLVIGSFRVFIPLLKGDASFFGTTTVQHASVDSALHTITNQPSDPSELLQDGCYDIQSQVLKRGDMGGDTDNDDNDAQMSVAYLQALDDLAALVGTLLLENRHLQTIRMHGERAFLPVQILNGLISTDTSVDLAAKTLRSADAIVVGILISKNRSLREISLRGNQFQSTAGENAIVSALHSNSSIQVERDWAPSLMYMEGYKALASQQGISTSGLMVEPMRADGWLNKSCLLITMAFFYAGIASDIATICTFAKSPQLYEKAWVGLSSFFLVLPTLIVSYSVFSNLFRFGVYYALERLLPVIFEVDFAIQTAQSFMSEMETTQFLEERFVNGVYRSIPNGTLQLYIIFYVAESNGSISFIVLLASALSISAVAAVLNILFDRTPIRMVSLAPIASNPVCVRWIVQLDKGDHDSLLELANYNFVFTVNYMWSVLYHALTLATRAICITWMLASLTTSGRQWIMFLVICVLRMAVVLKFDEKTKASWFHRVTLVLSLCITDAAWNKSTEQPWLSKNIIWALTGLTTLENIVALFYAAFSESEGSKIPVGSAVVIVLLMIMLITLRIILLRVWALPVHYPELYSKSIALLSATKTKMSARRNQPDRASRSMRMPTLRKQQGRDAKTAKTFTTWQALAEEASRGAGSGGSADRFTWFGWLERRGKSAAANQWLLYFVTADDDQVLCWLPPQDVLDLIRKDDSMTIKFTTIEIRDIATIESVVIKAGSAGLHGIDIKTGARIYHFRTKSFFDLNKFKSRVQETMSSLN